MFFSVSRSTKPMTCASACTPPALVKSEPLTIRRRPSSSSNCSRISGAVFCRIAMRIATSPCSSGSSCESTAPAWSGDM